jgi:mRNA-degrading endonuclease RelE of RelBE toxin-antitoxin system
VVYEIQFAATARGHLRGLTGRDRVTTVAAIEAQLSHEPLIETRNRKRLRPNPLAPWELRVGNIRVFYDVDEPGIVTVVAIGLKDGNRLYLEGEEIHL